MQIVLKQQQQQQQQQQHTHTHTHTHTKQTNKQTNNNNNKNRYLRSARILSKVHGYCIRRMVYTPVTHLNVVVQIVWVSVVQVKFWQSFHDCVVQDVQKLNFTNDSGYLTYRRMTVGAPKKVLSLNEWMRLNGFLGFFPAVKASSRDT